MSEYRFVPVSDPDDRAIEIKNPWWVCLLTWTRWSFVSTVKAALYALDHELIHDSEKMQKKMAYRQELADVIGREVVDARTRKADKIGRSEPFVLSKKEAKERIKPPTDRPEIQRLISFLHPTVSRKYGIIHGYSDVPNGPTHRQAGPGLRPQVPHQPGARTGFVLKEHANESAIHLAEGIGLQQVVEFQEPKQGEAGDRKARLKQLRLQHPQEPGESQGSWDRRLNNLLQQQDNQDRGT